MLRRSRRGTKKHGRWSWRNRPKTAQAMRNVWHASRISSCRRFARKPSGRPLTAWKRRKSASIVHAWRQRPKHETLLKRPKQRPRLAPARGSRMLSRPRCGHARRSRRLTRRWPGPGIWRARRRRQRKKSPRRVGVGAQASREADRLAKQAQERMATVERRASQAEKTKQAAEKRIETAGARPHETPPDVTLHDSQSLEALTKDQLLRLAEDLELESQSAASKQELIEAIIRSGGVPASALSKEELLRIARSAGSEMGSSMTKAELITAIDTSLVPVAGQQSEREAQCVYSLVRASGTFLWTPRQRPLQMPGPVG